MKMLTATKRFLTDSAIIALVCVQMLPFILQVWFGGYRIPAGESSEFMSTLSFVGMISAILICWVITPISMAVLYALKGAHSEVDAIQEQLLASRDKLDLSETQLAALELDLIKQGSKKLLIAVALGILGVILIMYRWDVMGESHVALSYARWFIAFASAYCILKGLEIFLLLVAFGRWAYVNKVVKKTLSSHAYSDLSEQNILDMEARQNKALENFRFYQGGILVGVSFLLLSIVVAASNLPLRLYVFSAFVFALLRGGLLLKETAPAYFKKSA